MMSTIFSPNARVKTEEIEISDDNDDRPNPAAGGGAETDGRNDIDEDDLQVLSSKHATKRKFPPTCPVWYDLGTSMRRQESKGLDARGGVVKNVYTNLESGGFVYGVARVQNDVTNDDGNIDMATAKGEDEFYLLDDQLMFAMNCPVSVKGMVKNEPNKELDGVVVCPRPGKGEYTVRLLLGGNVIRVELGVNSDLVTFRKVEQREVPNSDDTGKQAVSRSQTMNQHTKDHKSDNTTIEGMKPSPKETTTKTPGLEKNAPENNVEGTNKGKTEPSKQGGTHPCVGMNNGNTKNEHATRNTQPGTHHAPQKQSNNGHHQRHPEAGHPKSNNGLQHLSTYRPPAAQGQKKSPPEPAARGRSNNELTQVYPQQLLRPLSSSRERKPANEDTTSIHYGPAGSESSAGVGPPEHHRPAKRGKYELNARHPRNENSNGARKYEPNEQQQHYEQGATCKMTIPQWVFREDKPQSKLFHHIIGYQGKNQKAMTSQTNCKISISENKTPMTITISSNADSFADVRKAQRMIYSSLLEFLDDPNSERRLLYELAKTAQGTFNFREHFGAIEQWCHHTNRRIWMRLLELPSEESHNGEYLPNQDTQRYIRGNTSCSVEVYGFGNCVPSQSGPYVIVHGYDRDEVNKVAGRVREKFTGTHNWRYLQE